MSKDWTGNYNSIYKTLGASNHTEEDREENDFYATEPKATKFLLEIEDFDKSVPVWECANGTGCISDIFKENGYTVRCSDIIKRTEDTEIIDFLLYEHKWDGNIVTNPPYKYAQEFVEKALSIIPDGKKVAMFLKLQFLEGKKRRELFDKYPPKIVWVSSSRLICAKNAEFEKVGGSAVCYAWFVWEKGFTGDTVIKWFN